MNTLKSRRSDANDQKKEEYPKDKEKERSYAIKELNEASLKDVETFVNGVVDLAMEAKWLSSIQHQNIISLHGVSVEDPCSRKYFIIIDQLDDILASRIQTWKKRKPSGGRSKVLTSRREKRKILWGEQMMAAYGVASALEYLHSQSVMHRDLKPDDVGFNMLGARALETCWLESS